MLNDLSEDEDLDLTASLRTCVMANIERRDVPNGFNDDERC